MQREGEEGGGGMRRVGQVNEVKVGWAGGGGRDAKHRGLGSQVMQGGGWMDGWMDG